MDVSFERKRIEMQPMSNHLTKMKFTALRAERQVRLRSCTRYDMNHWL